MQDAISQTLSENRPLNQALLHIFSRQNWAGFLSHQQVQQVCQQLKLEPLALAMQLLPVAACEISHAWLRGEKRISDMVVNYTPCGHCRQFMNELHQAENIAIHLPHSQHNPLHSYLPDAFGPKNLDIHT